MSETHVITTRTRVLQLFRLHFAKSLGLNNGEKQNQFKVVIKKHSLKRKKEEENLVSSLETYAEYLPHSTCRYGFPGWLKGKTK